MMDLLSLSINRFLFCLVLGMVVPVSLASRDADDPGTLTIHYGGRSLVVEVVPFQDGRYISGKSMEEAFGGEIERRNIGLGFSFRYGSGRFLFEDRIPYFSYENRPYQLVYPPLVRGDDFLIPLQFFTEYLPYFFPDLLSYSAESSSLRDRRYDNSIHGIKRSVKKGETVVFLHSSSPPRFEVDASRAGIFVLDLFETQCRPAIADSLYSFGYVDSTHITESGRSTRFHFYIQPTVQRFRVAEIKTPPGISIVFSGNEANERKKTREKDRDLVSGNTKPDDFVIRNVVIDPGHGGKDPGAIGKSGLREKDVNLKIALEVEALLKKKSDLNVVMTRKKDTYVSLKDRTERANNFTPGLFVSIHCNASKKRELQGFEAYFLSVANTDEERAVETRENLSIRFDEPSIDPSSQSDLYGIFGDLAQNEYLGESQDWAAIMVTEFTNGSKIISRGVKQAGFFVLNGATMPSLLLELGYISNPIEEKILSNEGYQKDLAGRICTGITSYVDRYNRKLGR